MVLQIPAGWKVRFYIHAKSPEIVAKDAEALGYLLPITFRPKWGSVELVRAALELVRTCLRDENVQYMVLASESCLPLKPLTQVCVCVCFFLVYNKYILSFANVKFFFAVSSLLQCIKALEEDPRSWLLYDLPRSRFDMERKSMISGMCFGFLFFFRCVVSLLVPFVHCIAQAWCLLYVCARVTNGFFSPEPMRGQWWN